MLGERDPVAFLATCDARRARGFYEAVLGLGFIADEPHALVMDAHGIRLRIQKVERVVPSPYTVFGWQVPDVAAAVVALRGRGVDVERYAALDQDELGVWTSPGGARIAWFRDPDANILSITQPAGSG